MIAKVKEDLDERVYRIKRGKNRYGVWSGEKKIELQRNEEGSTCVFSADACESLWRRPLSLSQRYAAPPSSPLPVIVLLPPRILYEIMS